MASVHAQIPTYTTPQSVTAVLAAPGTACTGSLQTFITSGSIANFGNLGQTQHNVSTKTTNVTSMLVQIFGVDASGNVNLISDTGTIGNPGLGSNPVLTASGSYANIEVQVTCLPATTGTFTLNYTGSSATSNVNAGGYLLTQLDKVIMDGSPANTLLQETFQTPFGSSLGTIVFNYVGSGAPAGGIELGCFGANGNGAAAMFYSLPANNGVDAFGVPDTYCPIVEVTYTGGSSTSTGYFDYIFTEPGFKGMTNSVHVTGTTAVSIKPGAGSVLGVTIGTPAAGTISLFDLPPSTCTGTPSAATHSIITEGASNPPSTIPYLGDLYLTGICLKASAAMDITVEYQ